MDPRIVDPAPDFARKFLVRPADNDLSVRTGRQIIDACRLGISFEVWMREFIDLCGFVATWCEKNDGVRSCYCSPEGGKITFFFSPKSRKFDFALADELADLSIDQPGFNVGAVEFQQIPWAEIERFLDVAAARMIYGEEFRAPETVAPQP